MLSQAYQGNMWWIGMGLFSLFMLWHVLWNVRQKRKAGLPVDGKALLGFSLLCLLFFALSVFQVCTHDR